MRRSHGRRSPGPLAPTMASAEVQPVPARPFHQPSNRRTPGASPLVRSARLTAPHATLWASVLLYVYSVVSNGACTGFCAVESGVRAYLAVTIALAASAALAAAQIAYVALHDTGPMHAYGLSHGLKRHRHLPQLRVHARPQGEDR